MSTGISMLNCKRRCCPGSEAYLSCESVVSDETTHASFVKDAYAKISISEILVWIERTLRPEYEYSPTTHFCL